MVLVDSTVWIDYFRGTRNDLHRLDTLIDEGTIAVNSLILTELLPSLTLQKQTTLISTKLLAPENGDIAVVSIMNYAPRLAWQVSP